MVVKIPSAELAHTGAALEVELAQLLLEVHVDHGAIVLGPTASRHHWPYQHLQDSPLPPPIWGIHVVLFGRLFFVQKVTALSICICLSVHSEPL